MPRDNIVQIFIVVCTILTLRGNYYDDDNNNIITYAKYRMFNLKVDRILI